MNATTKPNHIGRKISRIRELRGMKQEALAEALNISQQAVSKIEQSEEIEDIKLEQIAKALEVSPETIKNFSEDLAINYFNNFYDQSFSNSQGTFHPNNCTFNPLDKLLEAHEENKKLYERLLKSEQDKIEYLEKLLNRQ